MSEPKVDRVFFEDNFPRSSLYGATLTNSRRAGFTAIFDFWDGIENYDVLEWLAYELATAWHETGGRMLPVREGFKSSDAAAYAHVTAYCKRQGISNYAKRHSNGNSYYGRGYVQLTHAINYEKMGKRLGVANKFYDHPDDVMKPEVAAEIMVTGMMDGLFRPASGTLFDHFNGSAQRWFDARDLINGDKHKKPNWANGKKIGTIVANYGKGFNGALKYS